MKKITSDKRFRRKKEEPDPIIEKRPPKRPKEKGRQFNLEYLAIPVEVFNNKKLTPTDMLLFGFINILSGKKECFATNAFLANQLGVSQGQISASISRLTKLGYIFSPGFRGRMRILKVNYYYLEKYKNLYENANKRFRPDRKKHI